MSDFGDVSIPAGGTSSNEGVSQSNTPNTTEAPVSGGSSPVDLSDDTLVRGVPGYNEPVRYGDLAKRLQADYTRKTQEAQRAKQTYETEWQTKQREIQAERTRLETLAQTLIQRQTAGSTEQDPLFSKLASAKYIDGPMMGEFIKTVQDKGFAPIVQAFKERDTITQSMYQEILELRKVVNGLNQVHNTQSTESKIDNWLSEGGYPKEAKRLAKEIYSAYEGDDLDTEFPQIFAERWNELQSIIVAQQRQRVDAAKRSGVRLPGRGGTGTPGKPIGLKGHERARDIASTLWDAIQNGEDS